MYIKNILDCALLLIDVMRSCIITCLITYFSFCTLNTVITADRFSFFHSLPSACGTALTAHRYRYLYNMIICPKT